VTLDEHDLVASITLESFYDFVKEFWSTIVAEKPVWNWHIEYLCNLFQATAERVFKNQAKEWDVIANVPPGTTKSTVFSVMGPAWILARMPSARIICGSHTDTLVLDLSSKCRQLVLSEKYQACFGETSKRPEKEEVLPDGRKIPPKVRIRDDQNTKGYWMTDQGGFRFSCTVGGRTPTGFHGHILICLPYETLITTDKGSLPIGEIVDFRMPLKVLGYDTSNCEFVWQEIEEYQRNPGQPLCRLTFSDGSVLEATAEHPVFVVDHGYILAGGVSCGDEVICVKNGAEAVKVSVVSAERSVRVPDAVYNLRVTGRHHYYFANGILVHNCDDPIDPQRVLSEAEIRDANNWMDNVISNRKVDSRVSVMMLIMQRLHQNDPTGNRLSKTDAAGPVKHVCLPAEESDIISPPELRRFYVDGLLDPMRLPHDVLEMKRATMGEFGYSGQYRQRPVPLGGGMFKIDRIQFGNPPTKWKRLVRFWDKAGTSGGDGAYTAGVKMGWAENGRIWVLNVIRGRWESFERETMISTMARLDGHVCIVGVEQEPGSGGKESAQNTAKRLAGFHVRIDRPTGDKALRADPFSVQVNASNVYIPEGAPWAREYIEEMQFFPVSTYKDQMDASCLVAGTQIETSLGSMAIERVKPGDKVLTRVGYKRVLWSGFTGFANSLWTIRFSNGSVLRGTGNHPVLTRDSGFVVMSALTCADKCLSLISEGHESWEKRDVSTTTRQWYSRESSTTVDCQTVGISGVEEERILCTEPFGGSILEISPQIMIFTTKMRVHSIIRREILNVLLSQSTGSGIVKINGRLSNWLISKEFDQWLLSGMQVLREGTGIESMVSNHGEVVVKNLIAVIGVRGISNREALVSNTAPLCVATGHDGPLVKRSSIVGTACCVGVPYFPDTRRQGTAHADVPFDIGTDLVCPVYNLEIDDAQEFFANGILVHNSGAFTLLTRVQIAGAI
jgi:predicted phage terminase large subunit-like protein